MERKNDWYLGLDIGTDSVGWAATNTDYTIPKFKGNAMWGIRLFDESNTAEERRLFRSARRRTQRKRERINLLQMLFDGEISKKDCAFFRRLKESALYPEDKSVEGKYSVFSGDYTDKDFHNDYPTIYHLRSELIHSGKPHDVRLVYLALHHLIKNRGHFLFDSLNVEDIDNFRIVYDDFERYMNDNLELGLECSDVDELANVLKDKKLNKTKKTAAIAALFGVDKKGDLQKYSLLSLLSGASVDIYKIFDDESLKDAEEKKIAFSGNYDDKEPVYQSVLGERFEVIEKVKALYDWAILADILNGEKYLSDAKVSVYEEHRSDLAKLKKYVKEYLPKKYNEIFKITKSGLNNYVAYTSHVKKKGRTGVLEGKSCSQEDFCAYLKKTLGECRDENYGEMFSKIELSTFMPKQVNKDNGVIPMQVNEKELKAILKNAEKYLDFLNEKDENGISVSDKIIAIFEYRIPYYVGPLNTHSRYSWLVRSDEKIYPWNYKDVINMDKTAEKFINHLTSKCTYLPQYDVIPKNSILYSKFTVLNELNNLRLDGKAIDVKLKQDIYNDLFKKYNKVTNKKLRDYLISKGKKFEDIKGIDGDFKSNLKSYRELSDFDLSVDEMEEIIKAVTIFGDDKKLLKKRLRKLFGDRFSDDEIGKLSRLKYSGWSALSKEFLTDVYCASVKDESGEAINIITALWETNDNLMQILYSDNYKPTFVERIARMNEFGEEKSLKDRVEELYVSPKVKRPIYQSLLVAKELEKIQGIKPKKIFVEVARGEEKKERKLSRKTQLLELYKSCKKGNEELYESLLGRDDDELKSDKLYFYYTQLGRDMYSGQPINLSELLDKNKYDIDHIFPRSKVKDDSLGNRVLVSKTSNAMKSDSYPLSQEIRDKMTPFWSMLKSKKLISDKKYARLTRSYALTDEELSAFVSRQLVETRQSTKAVAQILDELYPRPETEVVYVKAALASDFRKQFDMLKCREVNDYHHAKDAYLNVVVGNVYNVKYTHNKGKFVAALQQHGARGFTLNKVYDFDTPGAWDKDKSLAIVKKTMNKNNIRYTRYAFKQNGGLFDQMLVKKGKGQVPIKASGPISDMKKYGAYNRPSSRYFALVEYADKKGKDVRQLLPIDAYREKDYLADPDGFASAAVGFDAKVIIPCVKYNALLSFDDFRMHISSKSSGGKQLVYKPAVQLVLGYQAEKYIRNIVKYLTLNSEREINEYDGISEKENLDLYILIVDKMMSNAFSWKFCDLGNKLKEKTDVFESLSLEKQCYVIREILKILHANVLSGDLAMLGEAKKSGISLTNSKLSEIKNTSSIKLINQSVTGLYENEVELLK